MVGYPIGGDTISVTSGVVSRIEVTDYDHGSHLLGIQIDAAINFGNSGGDTHCLCPTWSVWWEARQQQQLQCQCSAKEPARPAH